MNREKKKAEKIEKSEYTAPELSVYGDLSSTTFAAGAGSFCDSTEDWNYSG